MKSNMSITEGVIRLFIGMIIAAGFGAFGNPLAFLGIIFITTGLGGWCPIYAAMKKYTSEDNPYVGDSHSPVKENNKRAGNISYAK